MRQLVSLFAVGVSLALAAGATAAPAVQPAKNARPRACAIMSRDLVEKYDTGSKQVLKTIPPAEEPLGANGSSCEDGNIGFQINPFARSDDLRKSPGKDWQPVTGVGDTAFFHNKANTYAEVIVWTGSHHFTIQMGAPMGGTVESVRPKVMDLANAIVAKLR